MTTLHLRKSISPATAGRGFLLIPLVLACFAFSQTARAVSPAPDGGYANANTAEGTNALFKLTTGSNNTANGANALYNNTTGYHNTAIGNIALHNNTTGYDNTATGYQALYNNATINGLIGYENTANGSNALYLNTTGIGNTANGFQALVSNTVGSYNTANGVDALANNTTGYNNAATGTGALFHNTTGFYNTANGYGALYFNTTGIQNTANGLQALLNNTGLNNIGLGYGAGSSLTSGSHNIDIGNIGVAGESNKIRIGTVGTQNGTFIAGISGRTVAGGVTVIVDTNGHLGTVVSSARFKEAIKPMDKASEAILALKPVTFRYKHELDPDGIPQFGLVAEEVEKINPDLVARDAKGEVYTVRYEAVNAMLLNEFLKEHRKVEQQQATITQLKSSAAKQEGSFAQLTQDFQSKLAEQQKQIKALTSGLEKVSAQVEVSKFATGRIRRGGPAPRTVSSN